MATVAVYCTHSVKVLNKLSKQLYRLLPLYMFRKGAKNPPRGGGAKFGGRLHFLKKIGGKVLVDSSTVWPNLLVSSGIF